MKRWLSFALWIILLSGCAPAQPVVSDSGVEGQVTIGPTCPVVRLDQPCPDRPYQATLTIQDQAGRRIAQVQSQSDGSYRLGLVPGNYILHPETADRMTHAPDQPFTVVKGKFTRVDIVYDSGIR